MKIDDQKLFNTKYLRELIKKCMKDHGFDPGELQISQKAIKRLMEYHQNELDDILSNVMDIVISHNNRFNYNPIKRISPMVLRTAVYWNDLDKKKYKRSKALEGI